MSYSVFRTRGPFVFFSPPPPHQQPTPHTHPRRHYHLDRLHPRPPTLRLGRAHVVVHNEPKVHQAQKEVEQATRRVQLLERPLRPLENGALH